MNERLYLFEQEQATTTNGNLTGHGLLHYLSKLILVEANKCRFCEEKEDETSVHILTENVAVYLRAYQIEDSDKPNLMLLQILHFLEKRV